MTSGAHRKIVLGVLALVAVAALLCWFCEGRAPSGTSANGHHEADGQPATASPVEPQAAPAAAPGGDVAAEPANDPGDPQGAGAGGSTGAEMSVQDDAGESPDEPSADEEEGTWDGNWLTRKAMDAQDMASVSPSDAGYDPKTEAQQLFHPFEMGLRASEPLEPVRYKQLLGQHKGTNAAALRRVTELNRAGHKAEGKQLYEEWSRLFELYRRKAYADQENRSAPTDPAPR